MSDLSHERERLYALVDAWIISCEELELEDARIAQPILAGVVIGTDDEGDEIETFPFQSETSFRHVQLGILRALQTVLEDYIRPC